MIDSNVRLNRIKFIILMNYPQYDSQNLSYFCENENPVALTEEQEKIRDEVLPMIKILFQMKDIDILRIYITEVEKNYTEEQKKRKLDMLFVYNYWASATYWTLHEASLLSLDCDPRQFPETSLSLIESSDPFANQYQDRLDLIQRGQHWGQISLQNKPSFFLAWAGRMGIHYPPGLELAVLSLGEQILDWKVAYDRVFKAYNELHESLEAWKTGYDQLSETHIKTVEEAKKQASDRENTIEALLDIIQEIDSPSQELQDSERSYASPYMDLMRQAIVENQLSEDEQSKKEVLKQWFLDNAPEGMTISGNKADMMATLIRLPESEVGGSKPARKKKRAS